MSPELCRELLGPLRAGCLCRFQCLTPVPVLAATGISIAQICAEHEDFVRLFSQFLAQEPAIVPFKVRGSWFITLPDDGNATPDLPTIKLGDRGVCSVEACQL